MGKIGLKIKANMNNVNKLHPQHPEQFSWPLKVRCTGCGEENPNWHLISREDEVEQANATVNFVYKCKCCCRENSLTVIANNQIAKTSHKIQLDSVYSDSDENKFKLIVAFDCRGLELTAFEPRDGWAVQSGKKLFEDVDLSSGDWCDYNDVENVPVEISDFDFQFETLK